MKALLFRAAAATLFAVLCCVPSPCRAGLVLYKWDFSDGVGNPTLISGSLSGLSVSAISIGQTPASSAATIDATSSSAGYSGVSGGNNLGARFNTGALSTGTSTFLSLTITNNSAEALVLQDFDFGQRSTGTGPTNFSLRSSDSTFLTSLADSTNSADSTWRLINMNVTPITLATSTTTTLRLYAFGGSGNTATSGRFDDITLTLSTVPEPTSMCLVGGGVCLLLTRRKARRMV